MKGNGRRWMGWIALAVAASTFVAIAGVALARLTTESASVTIAPQENGTATAACRSGSEAVAGGFAAPGLDPTAETGPAILSFASNRTATGKWQAKGHNFNQPAPAPKVNPGSGPLVAYAYCDKHDPSVVVRSKSTTVDGGGHATLTPKCARGSEAVSGGFQSEKANQDGLTAFAYTSKRVGDRAWKVSVQNPDSLRPHSVTAFAYCERHGPNLVTRSAAERLPAMSTVTITPGCPTGADVFSGGYQSTFAQSGNIVNDGFAYTSKRSAGDKWKVSAFGNGMGTPGTSSTETAFAYCAT